MTTTSFDTIMPHAGFERFMSLYRFKHFRHFYPCACWSKDLEEAGDPWHPVAGYVSDFNTARNAKVVQSRMKVVDEDMVQWKPQTTKLGGCPHLTHMKGKPVELGAMTKTTGCNETGTKGQIEIQRGAAAMRDQKYTAELGSTTACTMRLAEMAEQDHFPDGKDHIKGDSWFGSVKFAAHLGLTKWCTLVVSLNTTIDCSFVFGSF